MSQLKNPATVPNQKIYCTVRTEYNNRLQADAYALKVLSGSEFKVYNRMRRNRDIIDGAFSAWALSAVQMMEECNLSIGTYKNVIKSLIEKGFFVQVKGNLYYFLEYPDDIKLPRVQALFTEGREFAKRLEKTDKKQVETAQDKTAKQSA